MAKKMLAAIKIFFRNIYFKIYDLTHPPTLIRYANCAHCYEKYPDEKDFIKTTQFSAVPTEIRNSKDKLIRGRLSWTCWLPICLHCQAAPSLKPHKAILRSNQLSVVWIDASGNLYKRFEIPKDFMPKKRKKQK